MSSPVVAALAPSTALKEMIIYWSIQQFYPVVPKAQQLPHEAWSLTAVT